MVTNCSRDGSDALGTRPADDESLLPDGQQLADVLSEFARTMLTDFPIQAILDHLVERIVDILPISSAGVTLISPGTEPQYIAATNADALRYENCKPNWARDRACWPTKPARPSRCRICAPKNGSRYSARRRTGRPGRGFHVSAQPRRPPAGGT